MSGQLKLEFRVPANEREQVARLRVLTDAYLRCRFISKDDCSDGLFFDEHERTALPLVALDGDTVVGSARLIVGPKSRCPIQQLVLDQPVRSDQPHIEITQLASAGSPGPDRVRVEHAIMLGLIALIVRWSRRNDVDHWYAVIDPSLLRLFSRCGFAFSPIGPLQSSSTAPYLASEILPVAMNLRLGMASLRQVDEGLHDFFDRGAGTEPGGRFEWFSANGDAGGSHG